MDVQNLTLENDWLKIANHCISFIEITGFHVLNFEINHFYLKISAFDAFLKLVYFSLVKFSMKSDDSGDSIIDDELLENLWIFG